MLVGSTQKSLVSVVMPIKRCKPAFLEKSIASVLNQTLTDLELLLIIDAEDGSLEEPVLEVLKRFKSDERMRVVTNEKRGFVEALNTGLLLAKGKYIARMDGDDISLPYRLELQTDLLEKGKLDFVGGWAYVIDEAGKTIGKLTPPTDAKSIKRLMMLHNPFLHSSVTFRKSILNYSGLYNQALFGAEDYDLWLRMVSLGYKCANLPRCVLLLRETSGSLIRGKGWKTTRMNYARAKVVGLTRGFTDPLSLTFCFVSPFSSVVGPRTALQIKSFLRWFGWAC